MKHWAGPYIASRIQRERDIRRVVKFRQLAAEIEKGVIVPRVLDAWMRREGYSRRGLARTLGVNHNTVGRWLLHQPSDLVLNRMVRTLNRGGKL